MGTFLRVFGIILAVFIIFQFIPNKKKSNPPVDKKLEIKTPAKVASILKRSCYDCHSNETKWPWWSSVAPMSWSVVDDVVEGRKALNFSIWNSYSKEKQDKLKKGIYRTVMGPMPLPQYTWLHPEAKLTKEDIKTIRDWASDGKGFIKTDVR
ncbi:MAG: heme-binding domain-containing protein [Epsilonproteobacteria bacterium]|nr:heme-binding domain-containing protein [Campylobacterota bacterium]